jgi:DNA-binding PadR family transcriptional regulator
MSVRLFVLGVIYEQDSHGYRIKEIAHLWGVQRWANIQDGSIYHALAKLEEEGLIKETDTAHSESQRPRYMYRVTEKGRHAFLTLLRETCRSAPTEKRDIDLALAFLSNLPPVERVSLLKERHAHLLKARADLLQGFQDVRRIENLHPWVETGMTHSLGRIEFEIAWNQQLIETVGDWVYTNRFAGSENADL